MNGMQRRQSPTPRRTGRTLLLACALFALAACQSSPPRVAPTPTAAPDDSAYRPLATAGDGALYEVDDAASQILIYAFRGGKAAFAGHNHVIAARDFAGFVYVPEKSIADTRFDLQFPLDRLEVDDPQLRQQTGGGFEGTLSADAIAGTREHMLGPQGLDAAHFPQVRVRALGVVGEWPRPVAHIAFELHGVGREYDVPLWVGHDAGDRLLVRGQMAIRQTDFGLQPYSVLGGLLAVQDTVAMEFSIVARRWPAKP
jgi:polyisoprenoid-binding protein YceI